MRNKEVLSCGFLAGRHAKRLHCTLETALSSGSQEWCSERAINNKETLLIAPLALSALTDWFPPSLSLGSWWEGEKRRGKVRRAITLQYSARLFHIDAIKEFPVEISQQPLSSDSLVYKQTCVTSSIHRSQPFITLLLSMNYQSICVFPFLSPVPTHLSIIFEQQLPLQRHWH